jgi:asparagine synthase (glutamine-hydrolysing)
LGAIAAAFTKGSENAEPLVEAMLQILRHRGTHSRTINLTQGGNTDLLVGYATQDTPQEQIYETDRTATVLEGTFYETPRATRFAHERLTRGPSLVNATRSLLREPGAFACVYQNQREMYTFRDVNGLKPVYYARSRNVTAFASERKALWKIGFKDAQRAIPGYLYSISDRKLTHIRLAHLPRPATKKLTINQASSRLSMLLKKSIGRITRGVDKVSVAFSGGLDSALTALLAKKAKCNLEAVSVGLPGSQELSNVEQFAQELELPITIETFGFDALEEYVKRVVWLIEEPSLMKVSVAVPLHWAAMVAARRGSRVILCGQGSDELYGGYYKYARTLDGKGRRALVAELYHSVLDSAQVNYERDDQATSPSGVELRTPFADLDVIEFSLGIPSQFKVKAGNDLTRKWVLRDVAKEEGLPEDMIWRRKKAIQHGTGVENAIRKLAKKRGLTAEGYLFKVHEEMIRVDSMP